MSGAGRGIGRAHAIELARRGARVMVNDFGVSRGGENPDPSPAEAVVEEIRAAGGVAEADHGNIADPGSVARLVQKAVDMFGGVDAVVANAGINRLAPFDDMTLEDFHDIVTTHLFGSVYLVHAAYPYLRESGSGRIVLTSSQIAWEGKKDSPAYGVAKGGILGLMATLKLTAPAHGILVNAIAPLALTRAGEGVFPEPLRPFLGPEQIGALGAYLASARCSLNGRILIAGAGHFAAAETRETVGIDFDDPAAVSAEEIERRLPDIMAPENALLFDDAMDAVGATFRRLQELAAGNPAR